MRDGEAFAMRDICPHRGVPLSAGKILPENSVECPYHGWRFARDGVCRAIPSLVEGQDLDPGKIHVKHYPVREQDGLIWVYVAAKNEAPTLEPPRVPRSDGKWEPAKHASGFPSGARGANNKGAHPRPGRATDKKANAVPRWHETQTFPCDIDHAVIGLMDPAHGPYVHNHWWWNRTPRVKEKHYAPLPMGFVMTAHKPSKAAYSLLGDVTTEITFELPSTRFEIIKGTLLGRAFTIIGLTVCTPRDDERTDVIQVFYWPGWLFFIKPFFMALGPTFIADDRKIVELQREGLKFNPNLMLIQDSDQPAIWYHRVKKAWAEAIETGGTFANPMRERTLRWRS
ncbi:MAG TPA: aromatic ring-hydroxylating dioxygenase subunit alpha, partial [Rhizomicrobium sp.]|nr:aromatic ring-hydroxylating dioxygenase subunit alpha [Rhizomicrobium sp.]